MDKAIQDIIKNNGELLGAREYFLNHLKQFPTYDLITKDYIKRNPHLRIDTKKK